MANSPVCYHSYYFLTNPSLRYRANTDCEMKSHIIQTNSKTVVLCSVSTIGKVSSVCVYVLAHASCHSYLKSREKNDLKEKEREREVEFKAYICIYH